MKIHLRFYPIEQNGFAPVTFEINPFKYPYNSLEDRYEYDHFSKEEITKKHREIIEYIDKRLKAQQQTTEQTRDRVESILRPAMEDEFYTSNGCTLRITLLVPINNTMMDLSNLLGDYSHYTTYGFVDNEWHDPNIDSLAKIGLLVADSALLKASNALRNAESYMDSAKKQVKFLNGPNPYSVSDKKNRDELLESLSKKYTYVNDSVEECKQVVSLLDKVAPQITTANRGPRSWELAQQRLLQGKQYLKDSLQLLEELKNLIASSETLIVTVLEELSSDPIKQEQVNKWLLQQRLETRKNAIYNRLDKSSWINLDGKSLSEIEAMIVEFNLIKQDMTELNITGHWINKHKLFIESIAREKNEKINKELVFFEQIDFPQKNAVELVELSDRFAYLISCSQSNNDPAFHVRIKNIQEKINYRDVTLKRIEQFNKELLFFEQTDFSQKNTDELIAIVDRFAYLMQSSQYNNDPELHARIASIKEKINQRDVALQSEDLNSPVEDNNRIHDNYSNSDISLDQNIEEQQSFIKKAANAVRQFITWVLSSIKFILFYPLRWLYGEQQQSEQQPYNNMPPSVQSQQEQRVKSATTTQPPTFTPLMLARAQRELARKNAIATDPRNPIIGLEHNLQRPTNSFS